MLCPLCSVVPNCTRTAFGFALVVLLWSPGAPVSAAALALGDGPAHPAEAPSEASAYCHVEEEVGEGAGEFSPKVRPEMAARRLSGPIAVDGELQEAAWQEAVRIRGFTEIEPGDQALPPVCTEVLVGYDDRHLYVAFRASDPDPSSIRASLRNRDEIFADDWVGLIVDPYGDAAKAYEIFANPYGIQGDLLMSSTSGEDVGFDLVYASEGRITSEGYQVEMAIPFSSLRFPAAPVQSWRLTFIRTRPRSSRQQFSWATVDRDDPCFMCQFGTLAGLKDVEPGTKLDVIPAVVGTQSADLAQSGAPHSGLDNHRVQVEPSVNLRYNVTPSLAAEATVNPDFSQVESDAAQIDVNETFALSFPERRPFFQEGSDLFDTWIDVVYTRSINAPIAAGKVTGRFGRTSVAVLSAVDQQTPMLMPFEEQSTIVEVGQSVSTIVRARRTFGENSFVGATVTDQRQTEIGGAGSVVSADAKVQVAGNYRVEAQVALSDIHDPTRPTLTDDLDGSTFGRNGYTAALDGERFQGTGAFLSVDRSARHWSFDLAYEHNSPTFRTPNGFEQRNDVRRLRMWQGYEFYRESGIVERLEPGVYVETERNFAGVGKQTYGEVQLWARLKGQTYLWTNVGYGRERFRGVSFERMANWNVNVNSNFSDPVRLGFNVNGGRAVFRADPPQLGRSLNASVWGTLQPLPRLTVEPEVRYARMRDVDTDTTFFAGTILRSKTSVQITREFSLRLVTQYNHFNGRIDVEPLLSYELNPFSVFYVGTTHDYDVVGPGGGARPDTRSLVPTGRQVFVKVQYLFRR